MKEIKSMADVPINSIVELSNGKRFLNMGVAYGVFGNDYIYTISNASEYYVVPEYFINKDINNIFGCFKINKIYKKCTKKTINEMLKDVCDKDIIWQREEEPKEITIEEIEEKFGCKVKIVKEKTND